LYINKKISLLEALTGVNFKIKHLDKTDMTICTAPGDVISSGQLKVVQGKGMPFYNDIMSHGNLIIKFDVEFPKSGNLKKDQIEALKKCLPGPKVPPPPSEYEMLEDWDESMKNKADGRRRHHYDDDDDSDGHPQGQRVECGNQ